MNRIAFILLASLLYTNVYPATINTTTSTWEQASRALSQGNVRQAGEVFYNKLKTEVNGQKAPYGSYTDLFLSKSEQAVQLMSCIMLDMISLMEREFGQNGQQFGKQMRQIFADIERLKPWEPTPQDPVGYAVYQKARQRGRESAHLDCRQINKEYNQLKVEVGKMMEPLGASSSKSQSVASNTQRAFYYNALAARYQMAAQNNAPVEKPPYKKLD